MKCKFYSEVTDKCTFDGPPDDCTYKDDPSKCSCFKPKMIEYGSSDVYEKQDEFYKKYCRWCSSLVCTGVEDVEARKGCKYYQHDYKERIIEEIKLLGATQDEIDLLTDQIALNGINNNREPKSVAWAILQ